MTVQRLTIPALWSIGILAWAAAAEFVLPAEWERVALIVNGFALITLLIRDIIGRNDLTALAVENSARLERKLDDVIAVVTTATTSRAKEYADARARIDDMAKLLEADTDRRQADATSALNAQTDALVLKIEEGAHASRVAEAAANNFNEKLQKLGQQIVQAIPPQAQVKDIQDTVHESRDILKGEHGDDVPEKDEASS